MDIKSGDYEGHECVPSLTPEEERQAAELLKRAISTSPDKGVVQLATGGAVRRCFDWLLRLHNIYPHFSQWHSCKSPKRSKKPQPPAQGPATLKCREYEVVSVEKHLPSSKQKFSPSVMKSDNVCWLATASISSSTEIGPAQVLAIKADLAIPWNKLRLLRRYDIINVCSNSPIFRVAEIIRNSSGW